MTLASIPLRNAAYRQAKDMEDLRRLAKGTQHNIKCSYFTLATYLEDKLGREPMTEDVNYQALEDYFRDVVSPQSDGTHRTKRSRYITIVAWLMKAGYLEWGPNWAEDIPVRKADKVVTTRKRRFSDDEFLKFLGAAKRSHMRDYFLVLFLRLTGRRIGEVVGNVTLAHEGLVWGDVRWDEGHIVYNDYKGRRYGLTMPLTARLRAVLEAWREAYCGDFGLDEPRDSWYLFPALTGTGPISKGRKRQRSLSPEFRTTNVDKIFRSLMQTAGLKCNPGDGWHIIRKTFGNQRKRAAVAGGRADAAELTKNALGHADEATQRIYLDEDEERERYAEWANATPELSFEAMAKIPVLAGVAAAAQSAPETKEEPASAEADAGQGDEVYTTEQSLAAVIPLSSRRRLRALG